MASIVGLIILIVFILIALAVFGGLIVLQVFLSKKGGKAGLVLPIISFVLALLIAVGIPVMYTFNMASSTDAIVDDYTVQEGLEYIIENDEAYADEYYFYDDSDNSSSTSSLFAGGFVSIIILLVLCNIPTAIYTAIYLGCRPKNKGNQLDKMNIQDL